MSWTRFRYHIIFSTKERRPWLLPAIRPRLHQFIGGIIRNARGMPIEINGTDDHIHVVAALPATYAPATAARDMKANSSRWIHESFPDLQTFAWQDEYAGFSVAPGDIRKLVAYVRGQEEHHKKVSFLDEMKWFLKGYGIPFDERYL